MSDNTKAVKEASAEVMKEHKETFLKLRISELEDQLKEANHRRKKAEQNINDETKAKNENLARAWKAERLLKEGYRGFATAAEQLEWEERVEAQLEKVKSAPATLDEQEENRLKELGLIK